MSYEKFQIGENVKLRNNKAPLSLRRAVRFGFIGFFCLGGFWVVFTGLIKGGWIFWAIKENDVGLVRLLLTINPSFVNTKNQDGDPPINEAAYGGSIDIVEILISKGSNVNSKDIHENTPLHMASASNNLKVAEWLIEKGADVNAKNNLHDTPLHFASGKGYSKMIDLLVNKGAYVNAKNEFNGETPLHEAASRDEKQAVEALIQHGADVNAVNRFGETPLDCAEPHYVGVAQILKNYGAVSGTAHRPK